MGKQKPQFLYGRSWYMLAVIVAGCRRHLQEPPTLAAYLVAVLIMSAVIVRTEWSNGAP